MASISPELITFMVSAFWHGFYPNYYIFFFFCFLIEQTSSLLASKTKYFEFIDSKLDDKTPIGKVIYYALGAFNLNFLNFFGLFFILLFVESGVKFVFNVFYGLPAVVLILIYVILLKLPKAETKGRRGGEEDDTKKIKVTLEDNNKLINEEKIN